MISVWLMRILLVEYVIIAIFSLVDGKPWQAGYWLGATIITASVLGMGMGKSL